MVRRGAKVGRFGRPMSQRAEHYRGYSIDGDTQGRGWSVAVHPNTPDLPILRRAVFRVIHPAWTEAVTGAKPPLRPETCLGGQNPASIIETLQGSRAV